MPRVPPSSSAAARLQGPHERALTGPATRAGRRGGPRSAPRT
eukprot:CAMPEP_0119261904 /NCGR_PEP_ID=MMETSP1329-20130426/1810_1 /TAXON_ID=114041 /ORGANISM="Genus nov. species nov., Strain RCC1024" /LENGTH=41 /DNA_ID= /DNA_START= /DNA_END= /DNA_ORIENTATION=